MMLSTTKNFSCHIIIIPPHIQLMLYESDTNKIHYLIIFLLLLQTNDIFKIMSLLITIFNLDDPDTLLNFAKETWRDATTLYEPYDFDSVMHYEKYNSIFSIIRVTEKCRKVRSKKFMIEQLGRKW